MDGGFLHLEVKSLCCRSPTAHVSFWNWPGLFLVLCLRAHLCSVSMTSRSPSSYSTSALADSVGRVGHFPQDSIGCCIGQPTRLSAQSNATSGRMERARSLSSAFVQGLKQCLKVGRAARGILAPL